jgi:phosphoribosylformimino-5-aminoimidazole carboxamide ribotide isomerase
MTGRLLVIPAVDVLGTEVVRLEQGRYDAVTLRRPEPLALTRELAEAGAELIHLVDLDGARSGRVRLKLVAAVAEAAAPAKVQASGGIRSTVDARRLLAAGAARVVVGTAAFAEPDALEQLTDALGERLIVALDVRGDQIAVAGWTRTSALSVDEAIARCREAGVRRLLCTAVERDGTLGGPDLELLSRVCAESGLPVLAAGGIRSPEDLEAVAATGCEGAIVGRALLEGGIPIALLRRPV